MLHTLLNRTSLPFKCMIPSFKVHFQRFLVLVTYTAIKENVRYGGLKLGETRSWIINIILEGHLLCQIAQVQDVVCSVHPPLAQGHLTRHRRHRLH